MSAVASGDAELAFIDMTLAPGMGRDEEVRVSVTETVYAGAEDWLKQRSATARSPCRLKH